MPDGARRGAGRRAARGVCVCRVHARVEPWTPSARRPRLRAPRARAPSALMDPRMGARSRASASVEGLLTRIPAACSRERKMTPVRASASSGWRTAPARRPGRLTPARQPRQWPHLRVHLRLRLRLHLDLHLPAQRGVAPFFPAARAMRDAHSRTSPTLKKRRKSPPGAPRPSSARCFWGRPQSLRRRGLGRRNFATRRHTARARGGWCGAVCVWGG